MLILALDCSTVRGSVAVGSEKAITDAPDGGKVLWERLFPAGRGHGGELFTALQEGLQAAARMIGSEADAALARIIVGLGPGSYSGVRQSIAVATGLSLSKRASLAGVCSALALETAETGACHVIGDARRGTFYYSAVGAGELLEGPELLEDAAALLARLALHPEWPVLAAESVPAGLPPGVEAKAVLPVASRLLKVAPAAYDAALLEPIYLRPPSVTLPRAVLPARG